MWDLMNLASRLVEAGKEGGKQERRGEWPNSGDFGGGGKKRQQGIHLTTNGSD